MNSKVTHIRPAAPALERILRLPQVAELVGLRRSMIYRLMQEGEFPRPVRLAPRAVGWRMSDLQAWIAAREETCPC